MPHMQAEKKMAAHTHKKLEKQVRMVLKCLPGMDSAGLTWDQKQRECGFVKSPTEKFLER